MEPRSRPVVVELLSQVVPWEKLTNAKREGSAMEDIRRPEERRGSSAALTVPLLALLTAAGCADSGPTEAEPETPPTVMVLSDAGTEVHITSILSAAGMTVVDGGPYRDFVGDGLEAVDAVVLHVDDRVYYRMEPDGEAALVGYVLEGGGLFTIEWVTYSNYSIIRAILPADYGGDWANEGEMYAVVVNDAVTEELPSTFTPGPDHTRVPLDPKPATTTWIRGEKSGAVLVGWSVPGRVISWNGAAEYDGPDVWTDDLDRMVVNAVRYVSGGPRDIEPTTNSPLTLEASELDITFDGDTSAGDGDFYFTVRLTLEVQGIVYELDGWENILRQGSDGEVIAVDVEAITTLPNVDGLEVTAWISYYENDPGGPQATAEESVVFTYDAAGACWAPESSSACVSPGEFLLSTLVLQDSVGDPLDVSLDWTFGVE